MGLFRGLIVIGLTTFILTFLDQIDNFKKIPIIGDKLYKKFEKNKHILVLIIVALIELIL